MGSTVRVQGATADLRPWFAAVEAECSRFDPDSALSQLNRLPERSVVVPPLLFAAVQRALQAAEATQGAFDPTVLDAVIAAGYGRSFELGPTPSRPAVPAGRWREIGLDQQLGTVRLPAGVRLDLGGIGKGLAADGALARLAAAPMAVVDAGGDITLRVAPGHAPVLIEVDDPRHPGAVLVSFALFGGGVATSSTYGHRWGPGLHHIIDPRTGRPADTGIAAATVVAGGAAWAEVLSKACIVLGPEGALALLAARGCHGLVLTEAGEVLRTPGMEAYFHERG